MARTSLNLCLVSLDWQLVCLPCFISSTILVNLCDRCRLAAVKKAADAANRRMCFVGMSLNTYLEAAALEGAAPFDPKELIPVSDLESHDPNQVLIVTTGSQVSCPCIALQAWGPLHANFLELG